MVLGLRLTAAAVLVAGCSSGGGAAQAPAPRPTGAAAATADGRLSSARVGGRDLRLVASDGSCILEGAGKAVGLGFAAPCGFLRLKAGAAAYVHDYGAVGAVVLVGGPPATTGDFAAVGRSARDRCSDVGRAVIVRAGRVLLSPVKRSPLAYCPDSPPDEKYYYGIAHDPAGQTTVR